MSVPAELSCNLCWETLEPPFIVTSCGHAFCKKHTNHPKFDPSTCPGCRGHVPRVGGLREMTYFLGESDQRILNGSHPDTVMQSCLSAVNFWVSQERNRGDYAMHRMAKLQQSKDQLKQKFQAAYQDVEANLKHERELRQQAEAAHEEMQQENQHVKQKYQEEARKVHAMQETIISLKRKRGDSGNVSTMGSPLRSGTPHRPGGAESPFGGGGAAPMASPHRNSYDRGPPATSSFSRHRSPILGGGGLGGGLGGGGLSLSRTGTPVRRSPASTPRFSSGVLGSLSGSGIGGQRLGGAGRRTSATPNLFGK